MWLKFESNLPERWGFLLKFIEGVTRGLTKLWSVENDDPAFSKLLLKTICQGSENVLVKDVFHDSSSCSLHCTVVISCFMIF